MITTEEKDGRLSVTVFEPVLQYEVTPAGSFEVTHAGRRPVTEEYARRRIIEIKMREKMTPPELRL